MGSKPDLTAMTPEQALAALQERDRQRSEDISDLRGTIKDFTERLLKEMKELREEFSRSLSGLKDDLHRAVKSSGDEIAALKARAENDKRSLDSAWGEIRKLKRYAKWFAWVSAVIIVSQGPRGWQAILELWAKVRP